MANLWLSLLLLLECQQLCTIFTLLCQYMSKFPNINAYLVYLNGYPLLLCKCDFSENGVDPFILTFFNSYPPLGLMSIFTYSLSLSSQEAEPEIGSLMSLILWGSECFRRNLQVSEGNRTAHGAKQSKDVISAKPGLSLIPQRVLEQEWHHKCCPNLRQRSKTFLFLYQPSGCVLPLLGGEGCFPQATSS